MTTRGTLQLRPATPSEKTRPGDARRKVHFALKVMEQAQATIAAFSRHLPEWTEGHRRPDGRVCESWEVKVVETGTQRWSTYDPETGALREEQDQ